MARKAPETPFVPKLSQSESKAETVSRIAMSMIESDTVTRDAKIARLREARLAREAADSAAAPAPTKPARRTVKR
ncbi:hypothetical protein [Ancylobacter polymorphus]|uniref:Uncharacterized protein n=1 Tax=Ancylobacter polymorphus TaxID=223390 RepID=A0A9E7A6A4_9HYPH|nr:hypothetical protein [Ancylobacter polymorphus]UOK70398.1 hypothetical protein K9D25_16950 [Ancylobacter polymorphus]